MSKAVDIAKKHELWALIRALGRLYDEDEGLLRVYAKDRYEACIGDLDGAIACFRDLLEIDGWREKQKMHKK